MGGSLSRFAADLLTPGPIIREVHFPALRGKHHGSDTTGWALGGLHNEITVLERQTIAWVTRRLLPHGPHIFGLIKDARGGNFTYGLMILALGPIMSATIVLTLGHDRRLEHIPKRHAASQR